VAGSCSFDWDLRTIPADDPEAILAEYRAHCRELEQTLKKRFAGAAITTTAVHPFVPALDTPASSRAAALIRQLAGRSDYATAAYAAEAGQFAEAGFEAVICGPGSIAQAHRADEFIEVGQLEQGLAFVGKVISYLENDDR